MINNVSSSGGINPGYGTTPVQQTTGTSYTPTASYSTDSYTSSVTTQTTGGTSYPVSQLILEDPTMASKFSRFFISSSSSLLRVGSNWLGKFMLNMMAGNIPLITSSSVSTQISNSVTLYVGRADLVRTGMNPIQAMAMQDAGIKNVTDLARITNPADQAVLAQMANAAGASRGFNPGITQMNVASWVSTSQGLTKYL